MQINDNIQSSYELPALISIKEMCKILDKHRSTLGRWVESQKLFAPLYRNGRTLGWCPIKFKQWYANYNS